MKRWLIGVNAYEVYQRTAAFLETTATQFIFWSYLKGCKQSLP